MSTALALRQLELRLGSFQLGPVSLDLTAGKYLILLGPTGCGKTTLLRCLTGAAGYFPGRFWLDKEDTGSLPLHHRRLGYVSQVNDLFPHLTVAENIAFGLRYLHLRPAETRQRVERYLNWFKLTGMAHQSAATLSGGESKKVALARSLIVEPRLLLLDEPLGMLDHNERRSLLVLLKNLHQRLQTTTIHVTHDRQEAWGIADQCAVMARGRILQTGTVAEVFRKPQNRWVADFLGGENIFPAHFDSRTARVCWGILPLAKKPGFSRGFIHIRPEMISLTSDRASASGRIAFKRDYGEFIELEVKLTSKKASLLVHTDVSQGSTLSIGARVNLHWPTAAVHFFSEDDARV